MEEFYKDTKEQLFELINRRNTLPFEITEDNVMLSEGTPTDAGGLVEVGVRGIQDRGYRKNPIRVQYQRIELEKLFGGGYTPELTALSNSSLYKLLPRFNKILGTRFHPDDIENVDFIPFGNEVTISIAITAKATSKYYSGTVNIVFNRRWLLLEEVINPYINALSHPDPIVEGRIAVGLLTWGLDFTPIRATLGVDPTAAQYRGDFTDIDSLRNALGENYGIWGWPDNASSTDTESTVADYDTRDVERANENFQRVVVQTNIRQSEYVGTAYFHYNLP